jgi:hypothetical protein
MNMIEFEADYEEIKDEFYAEWCKPAWRILNAYRYGPSEFLETFEDGHGLIDDLISDELNDPDNEADEELMNRRIEDFFNEVEYERRRRRKMGVVLGDVAGE